MPRDAKLAKPEVRKRERREIVKADEKKPPSRDGGGHWELSALNGEKLEEATAIKAAVQARPPRPVVKASLVEGKLTVGMGDPEKSGDDLLNSIRLYGALGSGSNQFVGTMILRIADALKFNEDEALISEKIGAALAMVAAVEPTNELEATMAVQMVAANEAAMRFFRSAQNAQYMDNATAYSNMANKAMRSFALHAEAISKLRRGGEQVVKHVHVNEGGQAVIAQNITTGGRGYG